MVVVDYDGMIDTDDLPEEIGGEMPVQPPNILAGNRAMVQDIKDTLLESTQLPSGSLRELVGKPMAEIERQFITETLDVTGGNREETAKLLDIGERTLYRKIKEYGIGS